MSLKRQKGLTLVVVAMAPAIFILEFISLVCVDMEVTLELTAYVRVFCFLTWTSCLAKTLQASLFPVFAIFLISISCDKESKTVRDRPTDIRTELHSYPEWELLVRVEEDL